MSGDERVATPPFEALRKRLPWLGVNLVTAFVAASVVALFEGTISQVTALAVFMPIVAGMGGNAATQTLTVIVRGLALGELSWGNARKALFKEAVIGLGNGLTLGIVGGRRGLGDQGRPDARAAAGRWRWSATCSSRPSPARWCRSGLKALKVDPALASSVFITTFTDVVGFASFLGLATIFLRYLGARG